MDRRVQACNHCKTMGRPRLGGGIRYHWVAGKQATLSGISTEIFCAHSSKDDDGGTWVAVYLYEVGKSSDLILTQVVVMGRISFDFVFFILGPLSCHETRTITHEVVIVVSSHLPSCFRFWHHFGRLMEWMDGRGSRVESSLRSLVFSSCTVVSLRLVGYTPSYIICRIVRIY